jgi:hypothetical protein
MVDKKHMPTAIRLDGALLDEAEALAKKMSQPGLKLTRTDVLRMAIISGLKEMKQKRRAA